MDAAALLISRRGRHTGCGRPWSLGVGWPKLSRTAVSSLAEAVIVALSLVPVIVTSMSKLAVPSNEVTLRGGRKSVVEGKSVDLGGRRIIQKKNGGGFDVEVSQIPGSNEGVCE